MTIPVIFLVFFLYNKTASLTVYDKNVFMEWWHTTPANDSTKQFLIEQNYVSKELLDQNNLVKLDPAIQNFVPKSCFGPIESPVLLIYCIIFALIWLAILSTGLFFYFRRILNKLNITTTNEQLGNRTIFEELPMDKNVFQRLLPVRPNTEHSKVPIIVNNQSG